MKELLPEVKTLFDNNFNKNEKKIIRNIHSEIVKNPITYELDELWKLDREIGELGGYSMSANPTINPFPGGIGRTLFRPLQYARCDIEICDIYHNGRYAIQNIGLHLEAVTKYILSSNGIFGKFINRNITLGKAIHKIDSKKIIEKELANNLYTLVLVYNRSKHTINLDENRSRLFSPSDVIVFYLISRKCSNQLLKPYYPRIYSELGTWINRVDINRGPSNISDKTHVKS